MLSVAVGAGQFFWLLRRLRHRWLEHVCALALIVASVAFLYLRATWLQEGVYRARVPSWARVQQDEFFNVQGLYLPRKRTEPLPAVPYVNVLQDIGTIDWYTAMPMAENAIPRYFVGPEGHYIPNPAYRGEAFFVDEAAQSPASAAEGSHGPSRYAATATFAPNCITVQVSLPEPATLVINQNYHRAWSSDRGELFDRGGLIALRLRETGSYTIRLRYLPRSFVVGLTISVLSIAAWALGCWACPKRLPEGHQEVCGR
jgi:hypothetical protein